MQKSSKIGLAFISVIMFLPFLVVIFNSFKTLRQIAANALSFPTSFSFNNYARAWNALNFPRTFFNTLIVTLIGNLGLIVFAAMTGYWLIRRPAKAHKIIYVVLLASMSIPFQAGGCGHFSGLSHAAIPVLFL